MAAGSTTSSSATRAEPRRSTCTELPLPRARRGGSTRRQTRRRAARLAGPSRISAVGAGEILLRRRGGRTPSGAGLDRFAVVGFPAPVSARVRAVSAAESRSCMSGPSLAGDGVRISTTATASLQTGGTAPVVSKRCSGGFRLRRGLQRLTPAEAARWFAGPAKGASQASTVRATSTPRRVATTTTEDTCSRGNRQRRCGVPSPVALRPEQPLDARRDLARSRRSGCPHRRRRETRVACRTRRLISSTARAFVFHAHGDAVVTSIREHAST
jgi:hypothetical protein